MHQKTNQVHIGDYFCSSLTMQDHLLTAGAEYYTPKCDTITGGTVSVYFVRVCNEPKRRKNTAMSLSNTDTKRFAFHAIDTNTDF